MGSKKGKERKGGRGVSRRRRSEPGSKGAWGLKKARRWRPAKPSRPSLPDRCIIGLAARDTIWYHRPRRRYHRGVGRARRALAGPAKTTIPSSERSGRFVPWFRVGGGPRGGRGRWTHAGKRSHERTQTQVSCKREQRERERDTHASRPRYEHT